MPQAALQSPPQTSVTGGLYVPISNPNNAGSTPDNFSIGLPGFLAGVVSVAIQSGSPAGCQVVVEVEGYPGDFVPLFLVNPEKSQNLPAPNNDSSNEGGSQILQGPLALGSARTWGFKSIRARRLDYLGGSVNVYMNFREGAY